MTVSKPLTVPTKGQLRCFQCRKAYLIKDGNWFIRGNQQVFLCKACQMAEQRVARKT